MGELNTTVHCYANGCNGNQYREVRPKMIKICASRMTGKTIQRDLQKYNSLRSGEQFETIFDYAKQKENCRRIMAEIMLKRMLNDEFGADSGLIRCECGMSMIGGGAEFHCNAAYAGDWVICVCGTTPVGIDIEQIQQLSWESLICFLSDRELEDLHIKYESENERLMYCFNLWTLKKSYVQALGKAIPLNSFSIQMINGHCVVLERQNQGKFPAMYFRRYGLDPRYKLSVCAINDAFPAAITVRDFSGLHET